LRLLYKQLIGRYNFTDYPTAVDAWKSVAVWKGLYWGVAGKELSFAIYQNDRFGNFWAWPEQSLVMTRITWTNSMRLLYSLIVMLAIFKYPLILLKMQQQGSLVHHTLQ
jgi:hypothetical protein